ncbi:hypothetical protein WER86_06715 [Staphylococcus felis]
MGIKKNRSCSSNRPGKTRCSNKKESMVYSKTRKRNSGKVNSIKNPYKTKKDSKFKNIKPGEYIIIKKEPISWYFREFKETTSQNIKIAKVVIYD